jgi:sRNA-binding regulator protein Hfq
MHTSLTLEHQSFKGSPSQQVIYLDCIATSDTAVYIFTLTGKRIRALIIRHDENTILIAEVKAPTFMRLIYKIDIAFIRPIDESTTANG